MSAVCFWRQPEKGKGSCWTPTASPRAAPSKQAPEDSEVQQGWKDKQKNGEEKGKKRAEMQPGASLRGKGEISLPAAACSPLLCPCPVQTSRGSAPIPTTPEKKTQHHPCSGKTPWVSRASEQISKG